MLRPLCDGKSLPKSIWLMGHDGGIRSSQMETNGLSFDCKYTLGDNLCVGCYRGGGQRPCRTPFETPLIFDNTTTTKIYPWHLRVLF